MWRGRGAPTAPAGAAILPAVRRLLLGPALLGAVLLASCSSSHSASPTTTTTRAQPTTTTGPPPTAGPVTTAGPTTTAGAGSASLPAVSGGTDLSNPPVISAGTPPPPTSLQTQDLVVGTGKTAKASDTVVVHYVGANYADGKVFDSSWSRGQPATFPLNGVVPGFAQGIVGMKVGGRREIVIPPALGYGATGQPPAVSPNETLVFVVDLKAIQ